ncbi:MAG: ABC transporter ATP-binding protein [Candidatus Heimdallarchaeum endolithica]|uniref:ABC transporter ATP-binding protein n=1 Tax=Candidatus Heimdallarchaeum endolithica TaxID=2876572 RepID=A0A9Y1FPF1_9ARCH|nr:MAG: ABC transporter ATP-binding protein [Candidatus Heimdallarchaeum endolithica]
MLELKKVSKIYSGVQEIEIFNEADLKVDKGEMVSIVAPSGNGKSTLINLVSGLDHCDDGSIIVDNTDITNMNEKELTFYRRQKIGIVFQFFNLFSSLTALENVLLPAELDGKKRVEIIQTANELFDKMGLSDKKNKFPFQLSGGEQQRIAIARALINSPSLLLADEPTGNLDQKNARKLFELLKELNVSENVTMLIVTHDYALAKEYSSRVITIKDKKVVPYSQY